MPPAVAALLLAIGCAPVEARSPSAEPFVVWVCPPVVVERPAKPAPEERQG